MYTARANSTSLDSWACTPVENTSSVMDDISVNGMFNGNPDTWKKKDNKSQILTAIETFG